MDEKRQLLNPLIVGFAVVAVGYVIEKLRDELSLKSFLFALLLATLSICMTALVCRIQVDLITSAISRRIAEEIRKIVSTELAAELEAEQTLTAAAARAAVLLQAIDSKSPLSEVLLSEEEIRVIESDAEEEVYVVTRDLDFDEKILSVVQRNLRREIEYFYILPEDRMAQRRIDKFLTELALDSDARKHFHCHLIPQQDFTFPTDFVVYDPRHGKKLRGYVRLPLATIPGAIRVLIKDNIRLAELAGSLRSLIKRYEKLDHADISHRREG